MERLHPARQHVAGRQQIR